MNYNPHNSFIFPILFHSDVLEAYRLSHNSERTGSAGANYDAQVKLLESYMQASNTGLDGGEQKCEATYKKLCQS